MSMPSYSAITPIDLNPEQREHIVFNVVEKVGRIWQKKLPTDSGLDGNYEETKPVYSLFCKLPNNNYLRLNEIRICLGIVKGSILGSGRSLILRLDVVRLSDTVIFSYSRTKRFLLSSL